MTIMFVLPTNCASLASIYCTVWWFVSLKTNDRPEYEASDGGLRAPASSVCTQALWLSAAPAVAF